MSHHSIVSESTQRELIHEVSPSDVEKCIDACKDQFNQILSGILKGENQEAHKVEKSLFNELMKLGLLLLNLFFANHKQGDYGDVLKTSKGIAKRGRTSEKSYFSLFGKLKVKRYLYSIGDGSFAPLDIALNLPKCCYSYFFSEMVNFLAIKHRFSQVVESS